MTNHKTKMLYKRLTVFASLLILIIGIFAFSPTMTTDAQYLDGCDLFNSGSPNYTWGSGQAYYGTFSWQAGETIHWTINGPSSVYAILSGHVFDFGSNTTIQGSYTIPADEDIFTDFGQYSFTVLDVSCDPVGGKAESADAPSIVYPPDDRINWQFGDLYAVLYRNFDSEGNPYTDVYCWDGEDSSLGLRVDSSTASGTSADGCNATFYIGADGMYQFNINFDGKLYEIRCEDLACFEPDMSYYDPNE